MPKMKLLCVLHDQFNSSKTCAFGLCFVVVFTRIWWIDDSAFVEIWLLQQVRLVLKLPQEPAGGELMIHIYVEEGAFKVMYICFICFICWLVLWPKYVFWCLWSQLLVQDTAFARYSMLARICSYTVIMKLEKWNICVAVYLKLYW